MVIHKVFCKEVVKVVAYAKEEGVFFKGIFTWTITYFALTTTTY